MLEFIDDTVLEDYDKFVSMGSGEVKLNGTYARTMLFADFELPKNASHAGFSISDEKNTYYINVIRKDGKTYFSIGTSETELRTTYVEVLDNNKTNFSMKIILDGNFIEAFLNEEYAVSANTKLTKHCNYSLILGGNNVSAQNAQVCKLAYYNNIND